MTGAGRAGPDPRRQTGDAVRRGARTDRRRCADPAASPDLADRRRLRDGRADRVGRSDAGRASGWHIAPTCRGTARRPSRTARCRSSSRCRVWYCGPVGPSAVWQRFAMSGRRSGTPGWRARKRDAAPPGSSAFVRPPPPPPSPGRRDEEARRRARVACRRSRRRPPPACGRERCVADLRGSRRAGVDEHRADGDQRRDSQPTSMRDHLRDVGEPPPPVGAAR